MTGLTDGSEIILGIDPGSRLTGFGLLMQSPGGIAHIAHGTIVLDEKKNIAERLADLAKDLTTVVDKYRPTVAAVEDVFLFNNPRSALVLGQARGVALGVLGLRGLSVSTLSPTRIKSLVCGRGRAQKSQVARMVAINLGISVPKSPDASDALSIALALAYTKTTEHLFNSAE